MSTIACDGQLSHVQQVWSFRPMTLSDEVANPAFDPTASCIDYGIGA
ncbi:MAG: hypothetical protein ACK4R2_03640 [Roseateles sp.]